MRPLELMNYRNERLNTDIDLDRLDEISDIHIFVISGDEIATVFYNDKTTVTIDSDDLTERNPRINDCYDGCYILYSAKMGINRLDEFERRESSDWRCGE